MHLRFCGVGYRVAAELYLWTMHCELAIRDCKRRYGREALFEDYVSQGVAEGVVFVCKFKGGCGFGSAWELYRKLELEYRVLDWR